MSESTLRETLKAWIGKLDDLFDADEPLGVGHVLGLSNDLQTTLTQLTKLEWDHEAMEKALETIKMLHANHASILGDRCSMALDMGEIATNVILGTQEQTNGE